MCSARCRADLPVANGHHSEDRRSTQLKTVCTGCACPLVPSWPGRALPHCESRLQPWALARLGHHAAIIHSSSTSGYGRFDRPDRSLPRGYFFNRVGLGLLLVLPTFHGLGSDWPAWKAGLCGTPDLGTWAVSFCRLVRENRQTTSRIRVAAPTCPKWQLMVMLVRLVSRDGCAWF